MRRFFPLLVSGNLLAWFTLAALIPAQTAFAQDPTGTAASGTTAAPTDDALFGFAGAKWGASQAAVRRAVLAEGWKIDEAASPPAVLCLQSGQWSGYYLHCFFLYFADDRFYNTTAFFMQKPGETVSDQYAHLRATMLTGYGKPAAEIRMGEQTKSSTIWQVASGSGAHTIASVWIHANGALYVTYADAALVARVGSAQNAKIVAAPSAPVAPSAPAAARPPGGATLSARDVAQKAFPSVVLLVMQNAKGGGGAFGSGFFVKEDVVATNVHVIAGAVSGYAKSIGQTGKMEIAGVVGIDVAHDLVLLKLAGAHAPVLPIGDDQAMAAGDTVYAVGNPEGLEGTFSQGIVSGRRQLAEGKLLQITAPISPGSSGGPVLNGSGEVVGLAVSTLREGQNLNFAVPASYIVPLLADTESVATLASVAPQIAAAKNAAAAADPAPAGDDKNIEKTLPGFLGIPWGSTQAEARTILKEKGATFPAGSTPQYLIAEGLTIAGCPTDRVRLVFAETGLHTANVFFRKPRAGEVVNFYEKIKALLVQKYGKPLDDRKTFLPPYALNDGQEEAALAKKKATINAVWPFAAPDGGNFLGINILSSGTTALVYWNGSRYDKDQEREKNSRLKDL